MSQVYKNRKYIPKIKRSVKAPSKDRKTLEKVENEWIHEYATMVTNYLTYNQTLI